MFGTANSVVQGDAAAMAGAEVLLDLIGSSDPVHRSLPPESASHAELKQADPSPPSPPPPSQPPAAPQIRTRRLNLSSASPNPNATWETRKNALMEGVTLVGRFSNITDITGTEPQKQWKADGIVPGTCTFALPERFAPEQFLLALERWIDRQKLDVFLVEVAIKADAAQIFWRPGKPASNYRLVPEKDAPAGAAQNDKKRSADSQPDDQPGSKGHRVANGNKKKESITPQQLAPLKLLDAAEQKVLKLATLCAKELFGLPDRDCVLNRLNDQQTLELAIPCTTMVSWKAYEEMLGKINAWWLDIDSRLPESVVYCGKKSQVVVTWKLV
jgi:hypothetical protein